MKIEILNEKDVTPVLERTEIELKINFSKSTPKEEDVKAKIAELKGAEQDLIVIRKIANIYGLNEAKVLAYIYKDEGSMKKIEGEKDGKNKEG